MYFDEIVLFKCLPFQLENRCTLVADKKFTLQKCSIINILPNKRVTHQHFQHYLESFLGFMYVYAIKYMFQA